MFGDSANLCMEPVKTAGDFAEIMQAICLDKFEHKSDSLWDGWKSFFWAYERTKDMKNVGDIQKSFFPGKYLLGIYNGDNQTVGFACLNRTGIEAFQIFVPFRRKGYGKKAYALLESWIVNKCLHGYLDYEDESIRILAEKNAVPFWRHCGFVEGAEDDGFISMKKRIVPTEEDLESQNEQQEDAVKQHVERE